MNDSCAYGPDEAKRIADGDREFSWTRTAGSGERRRRQPARIHQEGREICLGIALQNFCW
jgi:hypothetical protein